MKLLPDHKPTPMSVNDRLQIDTCLMIWGEQIKTINKIITSTYFVLFINMDEVPR